MNIALLRPWCAVIQPPSPSVSLPPLCVSVCEPCPCLWQRQFGSSFDQTFCWFCCVSLSLSVSLSHSLGSFAKLNLTYGKRNRKMFKSCTCKTRNEQQNGRVSTAGITFTFIVQCQLYLTVLKFHFGVCQTRQFGNGNICYFACPARTLKYALNGEKGLPWACRRVYTLAGSKLMHLFQY